MTKGAESERETKGFRSQCLTECRGSLKRKVGRRRGCFRGLMRLVSLWWESMNLSALIEGYENRETESSEKFQKPYSR